MNFLIEIEHPDGRKQESTHSVEELLRPNGDEPYIAWLLRELDSRGGAKVSMRTIEDVVDLPGFIEVTGP